MHRAVGREMLRHSRVPVARVELSAAARREKDRAGGGRVRERYGKRGGKRERMREKGTQSPESGAVVHNAVAVTNRIPVGYARQHHRPIRRRIWGIYGLISTTQTVH